MHTPYNPHSPKPKIYHESESLQNAKYRLTQCRLSEDEYIEILEKYPYLLGYIERNKQTECICLVALQLKGNMLQSVKINKTLTMCLTAVKQDGNALEFVPKELQSDDVIFTALRTSPYEDPILHVHPDLLTEEMVKLAEELED